MDIPPFISWYVNNTLIKVFLKGTSTDTCNNMDESLKLYAELKKPDIKQCILYDFTSRNYRKDK